MTAESVKKNSKANDKAGEKVDAKANAKANAQANAKANAKVNAQTKKFKNPLEIYTGMSDTNKLLTITIIAFFLLYLGAWIFEGGAFRNPQGFCNILNDNAALIITSCGMSIVMITGGIDISVGGVVALVCMCCVSYLDYGGGNIGVSILIALGIGLAFGLIQGVLVAYFDIQPFIVTLAGMFFARGMTQIVYYNLTQSSGESTFNIKNQDFMNLKDARIALPFIGYVNKKGIFIHAKLEIGVIVALVTVLVLFAVLLWSKLGRHFYAVGGNSQSALMLGINVKRTRFISHILCGLLAGIAGYVYFLHVGSGSTTHATGMEMDAIASSIVGGTMLTGGVGNILGTFFGVLAMNTIKNIVTSAGLDDAWWTGITTAAMLCLFLVIQSVVVSRKKKSSK